MRMDKHYANSSANRMSLFSLLNLVQLTPFPCIQLCAQPEALSYWVHLHVAVLLVLPKGSNCLYCTMHVVHSQISPLSPQRRSKTEERTTMPMQRMPIVCRPTWLLRCHSLPYSNVVHHSDVLCRIMCKCPHYVLKALRISWCDQLKRESKLSSVFVALVCLFFLEEEKATPIPPQAFWIESLTTFYFVHLITSLQFLSLLLNLNHFPLPSPPTIMRSLRGFIMASC